MMNKIIWFRSALLICEHRAFTEALPNGTVLPIFLFYPSLFQLSTSISLLLPFMKSTVPSYHSNYFTFLSESIGLFVQSVRVAFIFHFLDNLNLACLPSEYISSL